MKKITIILLLAVAPFSFAEMNKETTAESKNFDLTKYCYYADLEYSKGSEMLQVDKGKTCTLISDTKLKYKEEQKNDLVWVSSKVK